MFGYTQNTNRPTDRPTDPRTHRQTNIEFFRYIFLFLVLLAIYPQNSMLIMRMRQLVNFAFFSILGGLPPLEGSYRNKNSEFINILYVLHAHKISLQSDNFYFLAPPLKGLTALGGLQIKK